MSHSKEFTTALQRGDSEALRRIPKADLHNHFYLGGNRAYIREKTDMDIPLLSNKLSDMNEMHGWVNKHIEPLLEGKKGRALALEATFAQAIHDGITVLEIGEDVWANGYYYNDNVGELVEVFKRCHQSMAPDIMLKLQIGLSRHCKISDLEEWIEPFLEQDCFYSIDLYGDDLAQPIENFKGIYRKAREKGLILKAHVGEWGDADSVKRAVSELELDEVQHGISAAQSPQIMYWLSDHQIQLNVCPTSNVMLSRVESIKKHPIRKLFDHGVKVTINSDDVLVFNSSVSEEYLKLFKAGVLNAQELDSIRENGLTI